MKGTEVFQEVCFELDLATLPYFYCQCSKI